MIVVTQQRRRGYSYSPENRAFVQDPESCLQDAGSGYSMLQVRMLVLVLVLCICVLYVMYVRRVCVCVCLCVGGRGRGEERGEEGNRA